MPALQTGISATRILTVQGDALYSPTGHTEHLVLSSPAMIMEMELACVDALGWSPIRKGSVRRVSC